MSDDKAKTAAMGALTQYLTQHKLRKTPERYTILEKVFDMSDHFSVETLNAALHADGYHVSCTTVYNTLELLAEASLVRRRTFGRQPAHYEKIAGLSNHHHLVCTRCGKVREVKTRPSTQCSPRCGSALSVRRMRICTYTEYAPDAPEKNEPPLILRVQKKTLLM